MTKEQYLYAVCPDESRWDKYKEDMKYNFVILISNGSPVSWTEGLPVVYGDKESAMVDSKEGDTIITEEQYYNSL